MGKRVRESKGHIHKNMSHGACWYQGRVVGEPVVHFVDLSGTIGETTYCGFSTHGSAATPFPLVTTCLGCRKRLLWEGRVYLGGERAWASYWGA
jgi:hypothetical protein